MFDVLFTWSCHPRGISEFSFTQLPQFPTTILQSICCSNRKKRKTDRFYLLLPCCLYLKWLSFAVVVYLTSQLSQLRQRMNVNVNNGYILSARDCQPFAPNGTHIFYFLWENLLFESLKSPHLSNFCVQLMQWMTISQGIFTDHLLWQLCFKEVKSQNWRHTIAFVCNSDIS